MGGRTRVYPKCDVEDTLTAATDRCFPLGVGTGFGDRFKGSQGGSGRFEEGVGLATKVLR
jgi:hypothetical protein